MNDFVQRLLTFEGIRKFTPATSEEISLLYSAIQVELPNEFIEILQHSNGVSLPSINAELMSVQNILKILESLNPDLSLGLLPILDTHSSDYMTFCYHQPLIGTIVYMPHDNDAKLMYRSFNRFLEVLLECLEKQAELEANPDYDEYDDKSIIADLFFSETVGDFDKAFPRTEKDQIAAQILLLNPQGWNSEFAKQLLIR